MELKRRNGEAAICWTRPLRRWGARLQVQDRENSPKVRRRKTCKSRTLKTQRIGERN